MKRRRPSADDKTSIVIGEIISKGSIAGAKYVAAAFTGSSAMVAEAIHTTVDAGNALMLLLGKVRSRKPPDAEHRFGHGMELYFWSLIVAVSIFSIGGGIAGYQAIRAFIQPKPLESPVSSYWVLGISVIFELCVGLYSFKNFWSYHRSGDTLWKTIRRTKDPRIFSVLFDNVADLLGLIIALLGIFLAHRLQSPRFDSAAGVLIALIQAVTAVCLAYESKELLLGASADKKDLDIIRQLVETDRAVEKADLPMTMHLGPEEVLLNLGIKFRAGLAVEELIHSMARIVRKIQARHPEMRRIFLDADALRTSRQHTPTRNSSHR